MEDRKLVEEGGVGKERDGTSRPGTPRRGVPLAVMLSAGFGLLVLVSVGAVLGIGLWMGTVNTIQLLRDKAEITVTGIVERIEILQSRPRIRPASSPAWWPVARSIPRTGRGWAISSWVAWRPPPRSRSSGSSIPTTR
jgi:hypothetical protein